MVRLLTILFLSVLSVSPSLSQNNIQKGYVVTLNNDTLSGYIKYRNNRFNCTKCIYYSKTDNKPITFLPGEIYSYRFNDSKYYVSRKIKKGSIEKWVFLEYLVNGIANLYFQKDNDGVHYFIEKDTDLIELTNKITIVRARLDNGYTGEVFKESFSYRGVLSAIFSDAMQLQFEIKNARFNRKSLIKLTEDYHNLVCTDRGCIIYEKDIKIQDKQ